MSGVTLALRLPDTDVGEIARLYGYELPPLPVPPVTGLQFHGDAEGFTLALDGPSSGGSIVGRNGRQALAVPVPGGCVLATLTDLAADEVEALGVLCAGPLPAGVWLALPGGSVVPDRAPTDSPRCFRGH
ncbi:hypothetical protein OG530_32150 [Streptomyces decoyicus]|uniref:hypothetical protein n=1 Tax=Streptomyces decoyicus TaxID=249567 RepID=UPI002E176388